MERLKILFISIVLLMCVVTRYSGGTEDPQKREKLTHYLSSLVSMNTVTSDKEANGKALSWVENQLGSLPLHFTRMEYEGYHSLLITPKETKKTKLWLMAHIDVVPAKEELFRPAIKENNMYGRGAYDMKMAIAAYILLMHELQDKLGVYDFGIMLTSDEEIGGANGVKRLLEEGYSSDVVLLPDGGFDWKFEEAAKGVLQIKLTSQGVSAHGSRPWNGENAIVKLMDVLHEIEAEFDKEKSIHAHYFPTANLGVLQGGKSVNQVPDFAEAKLDIRFPPPMTSDQIVAKLKKITEKYKGISLEKLIEGSPHQVNLNLEPFDTFRSLAKKMYGIEVGSTLSHGASDARFFGEKGIPVLVIAPKGGDIHSDNEWVDLEDLVRFYEVMKAWVMEVSHR